ncbi:acid sphingomyelinase-like phosphodiesterase 3b [Schistocerca americana]|uniref:acid sphingomyelinase-like phosphodiesterase 3b n=1 Tax=Schistocerca americana TaxID=7009 RepID=UPI001F4F6F4E|nr:acid sphingomyelinase-like phosphodiesterase 3b [Schistocerca americana]
MLVAGAALLLVLLCPASHAKIGYFWHITDIHYDPKYDRNGDPKSNCWRSDTGRAGGVGGASPGQLGDYRCDAPWDLVESAVRAMKSKHGDNIDFILWTGCSYDRQQQYGYSDSVQHSTLSLDLEILVSGPGEAASPVTASCLDAWWNL